MARKTLKELERETNAVIKLVLSEMEILAAMPPEQACDPVSLDQRRRHVVRKLWNLMNEALDYGTHPVE